MNSTLTREDRDNFWVHLYFGTSAPNLSHCIDRAYLDFSRTVYGIGSLDVTVKAEMNEKARKCLKSRLSALSISEDEPSSQETFDWWHQTTCLELCEVYRAHGFESFCIGQAQKWINMTFKYLFVLGEERVPGFQDIFPFCHVPIDNVMIEAFKKDKSHALPPKLPCAWSRINDYTIYLDYQKWIRTTYTQSSIEVEFRLWMENGS